MNTDLKFLYDDLPENDPKQMIVPTDPSKGAVEIQFESNNTQKLNVQDIKDALLFFNAVSDGLAIRLIALSNGNMQEFSRPDGVEGSRIDPILIDLYDKLCFIQHKTHSPLFIQGWLLSSQECDLIYKVHEIIQTGRTLMEFENSEAEIGFNKPSLELGLKSLLTKEPVTYENLVPDMKIELLGTTISLGPGIHRIIGFPMLKSDELNEIIQSIEGEEMKKIRFRVLQGGIEFPNWSV